MSDKIHRNSLRPEHRLHWYVIERVLGQGGFGITYLAFDFNLDQYVAIKEYLPMELAVREGDNSVYPASASHSERYRWGLERFIAEARTLAKFKHPAIVRVLSVFEENHTAYMVMEYERGESLQEILARRKTLEEEELIKILFPLLGGLELIHSAGFIHRDIKPANIFIREDHSPVLLDFGSARQALGLQTRTLTSIVSPGYAPFEQYYSKSDKQGPWTDVYGLGATLYRAISGRAPMDAIDRSEAILKAERDVFVPAVEVGQGRYSQRFLKAVDHALQFSEKQRPQSVSEWREEFGIPTEEAVSRPAPTTQQDVRTEFAPPPLGTGAEQDSMTLDITTGEVFASAARARAPHAPPSEALRATEAAPASPSPSPPRSRKGLFGALAVVCLAGAAASIYFLAKRTGSESPAQQAQFAPAAPHGAGASATGGPALSTPPPPAQEPDPVEMLLKQARRALQNGRGTGTDPGSAASLYRRVLSLDPGNAEAAHGMEDLAKGLAADGRKAAARHDYALARRYLQQALGLAPQLAGIKAELQGLDEQQRQRQLQQREAARARQIQALLAEAEKDQAAGRLTAPPEDNALADYQAVLVIEPGNAAAEGGIARIAASFADKAREAQARGDWAAAEGALRQALQVSPRDSGLRQALQRLRAEREKAEKERRLAARAQRVRDLLGEAREHVQALRLTTPAGNNALETYRRVLALDPDSAEAKQGIQRIADKYVELSRQASSAGDLDRAGGYLERADSVSPGAANIRLAREQLALRRQRLARAAEAKKAAEEAKQQAQREAEEQRRAQEKQAAENAAAVALLQQQAHKDKRTQPEAAAREPIAAIRITGLTRDFQRYGLDADRLRSSIEKRLSAAGYKVQSVEQASLARDAVLVNIVFHANLNSSIGTYSYSASLKVMGRLAGGTGANAFAPQPIWSGGENGLARPIELSRLNGVYLDLLGQFLAGKKGL